MTIGQPEGTAFFSGVSTVAGALLAIDDLCQGNKKEAFNEGLIIIAGMASSKALKAGVKAFSKSINITVGSTGRYYEVGHRGAIKSEKALRKILAKDIADGYFGQEVIPNAPLIIEQAVKIYNKLMGDKDE